MRVQLGRNPSMSWTFNSTAHLYKVLQGHCPITFPNQPKSLGFLRLPIDPRPHEFCAKVHRVENVWQRLHEVIGSHGLAERYTWATRKQYGGKRVVREFSWERQGFHEAIIS